MDFSDSSDEGPGEQAFDVKEDDDVNYDPSVPPSSANEYLLRVRREAKKCPQVVVADMDTSLFLPQQTVKITEPTGLLPVPDIYKAPMPWQRYQVAEFAALRQKLIQFKAMVRQKKVKVPVLNLPEANDAENWCRLCFGRLKLKTKTEVGEEVVREPDGQWQEASAAAATGGEHGTPPLLHIIAQMDQAQVTCVLEFHVNWLEATGFSTFQGQWFYSLLANLQKPLTPEACSWLRRLARLCSNIRGSLDSETDPQLSELNLLICLVSRYFEQRDLADS